MKPGGREIFRLIRWIVVQTVPQIRLNDLAKLRILEETPRKTVDQRGETRNRGCHENAARPKDASRFKKRLQTVRPLVQMVQRPQQKNGIDAACGKIQLPCVSQCNRGQSDSRCMRVRPRLLQMQLHRINQVDFVSLLGKRERIGSRPAAYVENSRRWRRQMPS